jgi:hypothetical protein
MAKVAEFKHLFTDSRTPTAAVTRCRFVDKNGDMLTVAGTRHAGVSMDAHTAQDVTDGKKIPIVILGIAELEVGGVVAVGDKLASDASARGVVATAGQAVNAIALTAGTGAGDRISALLISDADKVASAFVADPAAGGTVDTQARAAIVSILDILIAHGLMASA